MRSFVKTTSILLMVSILLLASLSSLFVPFLLPLVPFNFLIVYMIFLNARPQSCLCSPQPGNPGDLVKGSATA